MAVSVDRLAGEAGLLPPACASAGMRESLRRSPLSPSPFVRLPDDTLRRWSAPVRLVCQDVQAAAMHPCFPSLRGMPRHSARTVPARLRPDFLRPTRGHRISAARPAWMTWRSEPVFSTPARTFGRVVLERRTPLRRSRGWMRSSRQSRPGGPGRAPDHDVSPARLDRQSLRPGKRSKEVAPGRVRSSAQPGLAGLERPRGSGG